MASKDDRGLEAAKKYLLRLLRYRPRSKMEAEQRLKRAGFGPKIISDVLSYAESYDLIDDEKFARLWVSDRLARKPKGKIALRQELQAKGISKELIEQALAQAKIDEKALMRELAQARLQAYRHEAPATQYHKTVAFLIRRGFSPHDAQEIVQELIPEPQQP